MATQQVGSPWELATSSATFSVQCVSPQDGEVKRMAAETPPAVGETGNKLSDTQVADQDNLGGTGAFIYIRSYGGSSLQTSFQVD